MSTPTQTPTSSPRTSLPFFVKMLYRNVEQAVTKFISSNDDFLEVARKSLTQKLPVMISIDCQVHVKLTDAKVTLFTINITEDVNNLSNQYYNDKHITLNDRPFVLMNVHIKLDQFYHLQAKVSDFQTQRGER